MDAKNVKPLCFGVVSHKKVRHNDTQKNRTDGQTPLTSVEQQTGLELDGLQARGQVWSQSSILVGGLVGSDTFRGSGEAFAVKTEGQTIRSIDGGNRLINFILCGLI